MLEPIILLALAGKFLNLLVVPLAVLFKIGIERSDGILKFAALKLQILYLALTPLAIGFITL